MASSYMSGGKYRLSQVSFKYQCSVMERHKIGSQIHPVILVLHRLPDCLVDKKCFLSAAQTSIPQMKCVSKRYHFPGHPRECSLCNNNT